MKRGLLIFGAGVAIVAVGCVGIAPTVLSRLAPRMMERSFARQYAGSVKVRRLDLDWFDRTVLGPVEVFDQAGAKLGEVTATAEATAWQMLRDRWWRESAPLDLGEILLHGDIEVERG